MVITLDVPYVDTTADTLALSLDETQRHGLDRRRLVVDQWAIEVIVLAASHQIVVTGPGSTSLIETVACDVGAGPLPSSTCQRRGTFTHDFTSGLEQLEPIEFQQHCEGLIDRLTGSGSGLIAEFPGRQNALTAISLDVDHVSARNTPDLGWQTWHTYPESGAVVHTITRVQTNGTNRALRAGDTANAGQDGMRL